MWILRRMGGIAFQGEMYRFRGVGTLGYCFGVSALPSEVTFPLAVKACDVALVSVPVVPLPSFLVSLVTIYPGFRFFLEGLRGFFWFHYLGYHLGKGYKRVCCGVYLVHCFHFGSSFHASFYGSRCRYGVF